MIRLKFNTVSDKEASLPLQVLAAIKDEPWEGEFMDAWRDARPSVLKHNHFSHTMKDGQKTVDVYSGVFVDVTIAPN